VTVSVDVKNTGSREGTEIVQMYITDDYCSVSRAVKELKGFARVSLKPGQTRTVSFTIDRKALEFYNADLEKVVEKGTFTITVGPSSTEGESVQMTLK
jgi:beta-glucosidase